MLPAETGFKMPPEWSGHARTIMEWPVKEADWPEPFAAIIPAYVNIVKTIACFEPVTLIVNPHLAGEAAAYFGPEVEILELEHDDSWVRDNGPTFLLNERREIAGINWIFNGWGGKYPATRDNLVAPRLLDRWRIPRFDAPLVLEGGSFHVDGAGTLLTTTECLLNPNRNPSLRKEDIERYLRQYLGITKIIWLKRGWVGDDTDGHVDNLACFAKPGVVITQVCPDPTDENYEISRENLAILKEATDAQGRRLEIVELNQPPAAYYDQTRLTLSYLNFYFVNGGLVLPVFGGKSSRTDREAALTLRRLFPDRRLATVDGLIIARGGGNVHCLTQQLPESKTSMLGSEF